MTYRTCLLYNETMRTVNYLSLPARSHQVYISNCAHPFLQDPKIVLYSPEELGLGKSGKAEGFPFR